MRASGARRCSRTADSLASSSADAPSEIELELAAVMVPPSRNAGFSVGMRSIRARRGCSSSAIVASPIVIGAISCASSPLLVAALARSTERGARTRPFPRA